MSVDERRVRLGERLDAFLPSMRRAGLALCNEGRIAAEWLSQNHPLVLAHPATTGVLVGAAAGKAAATVQRQRGVERQQVGEAADETALREQAASTGFEL